MMIRIQKYGELFISYIEATRSIFFFEIIFLKTKQKKIAHCKHILPTSLLVVQNPINILKQQFCINLLRKNQNLVFITQQQSMRKSEFLSG